MTRARPSMLAATLTVTLFAFAAACGTAHNAAEDDTLTAQASATAHATSTTARASATPPPPPSSTPGAAAAPATTATTAPCTGRCPGNPATQTPPPTIGDDGVPRVPPLLALTFSPGEALLPADLVTRGAGDAGRGTFLGQSLVIPSIGVDALIETQVVGSTGDMPEPSSFSYIAWYDFSIWPGLGGVPLGGGNSVMAANLGGIFAQLAAVQRGEIVVLHLADGRRLFYHVEFNKTIPAGTGDWQDVVSATADESLTLITAAGSGSGQNYSHRRIVWARRVNCQLREAPETPTRAPYVECELPE